MIGSMNVENVWTEQKLPPDDSTRVSFYYQFPGYEVLITAVKSNQFSEFVKVIKNIDIFLCFLVLFRNLSK